MMRIHCQNCNNFSEKFEENLDKFRVKFGEIKKKLKKNVK